MKFDRAHVQCTDKTHCEKSMLPFTKQINSLVISEHVLMWFKEAWHNRWQISRNVSSVRSQKDAWWMIPVVVLRSQIYDAKLDFVPSLICWVYDSLSDCYSLVLICLSLDGFQPKQELVDPVLVALYAIDSTLSVIDFPKTKDFAITRWDHYGIWKRSFIQVNLPRKKLVESSELIDIFLFDLVEIEPINTSKTFVNIRSQNRW